MILSEGIIIATLATMGFTTLMRWLKDKVIKNPKVKIYIPNGFLLSLIFGLASLPVLIHFNLLGELKEPLWEFLGALITDGTSAVWKLKGTTLEAVEVDVDWTSTKDNAATYNVYFEGGALKLQNKVGNNKTLRVGFYGV